MKTAGDILSALFDERFLKKAQGYSKLFDSWADITAKNGIASAADHSRIKDLDNGILLVEMDHPGWKQILQTKQGKLLNDFRYRFPELEISGISLMLGSGAQQGESLPAASAEPEEKTETETINEPQVQAAGSEEPPAPEQIAAFEKHTAKGKPTLAGFDAIKDEEFREKLIKLGQTIAAGEKA